MEDCAHAVRIEPAYHSGNAASRNIQAGHEMKTCLNSVSLAMQYRDSFLDSMRKLPFSIPIIALIFLGFLQTSLFASRITYDIKTAGNVSLAIYNEKGHMVRELLRAKPQEAGSHTIKWDGLDRQGKPVPPGTYTWKLLESQGLEAEYLLTLGTNVGINGWPGVHGGPSSVTVSGDQMFMAGAGSETAPGIASAKLDGTFVWSNESMAGWDAGTDMAVVGDRLWVQYQGDGSTRAADTATGHKTGQVMIHTIPVLSLDLSGDPSTPTAEGFQAFPPEPYTKERGYGWKTVENMTTFAGSGGSGLVGGHQVAGVPAKEQMVSFLVDIPERVALPDTSYTVVIHLGGGTPSPNDVSKTDIQCGGKWRGSYNAGDPPKTLKFTIDDMAGQIAISFYSEEIGKTFGAALRGIEVLAHTNRLAADDKQMLVAAAGLPDLLWVEPPAEGASAPNASIRDRTSIPNLRDIALLPDGGVVAISGNDLVTLSRKEKQPVVRVRGLDVPAHLAVDQSNGDILVALLGKSNQIVRFDRNFKELAAYGKKGGRSTGRFIPENFAGISNLASDNKGGFLVSEWYSPPRRIASFNREGKLLYQWFGGQMFYHSVGVDPEDPSRVWLNSQFGSVIEMKVDYDARTWDLYSTWILGSELDPKLFNPPGGFWCLVRPFTIEHDGKKQSYLWTELTVAMILQADYENGRLVTRAAAGASRFNPMKPETMPEAHPWKIAATSQMTADGKSRELHAYTGFSVADANGDGQFQPEEFRMRHDPGPHGFGFSNFGSSGHIDKDLNAWRWGYEENRPSYYKLSPVERTSNGLPIWDLSQVEKGPAQPGVRTVDGWPTKEALYTLEYREGDGFSRWWTQTYWDGHGFAWPSTMLNETALVRRDHEGNVIWESGPHHSDAPDGPRGRLDMPMRIAGVVNGYIGVNNQVRQPCEFWSEDGLYVGGLFDRRAQDGLPDYVYAWWRTDEKGPDAKGNRALINYDMGHSGVLARRPNGDVLFFAAGWNDIPVYRINGWDKISRQQGTIQVGAGSQAAKGTGTGLFAEYYDNGRLDGEPSVRRIDPEIFFSKANKAKATGGRIPWPEPEITGKRFSVRWTGFIEPKYTEDLAIHFYGKNAGVRMWLGEELVFDNWRGGDKKLFGSPRPVVAGEKIPIKIEYRFRDADPFANLVWESVSQPVSHIPPAYLYPAEGKSTVPHSP
jgi:hypothetical protein